MADLIPQLERCFTYWHSRDAAVTGVRLWLGGSNPDLPLLAENLRRSGEWSVQILDPVVMGWMALPQQDGDGELPPGWALSSLHGLMQAEPAR